MYKKILSIAILIILFSGTGFAQSDHVNTVIVSGVAEIYVIPDEAVINMGIKIWDEDMESAKKRFYENSYKLSSLLNKYNIDKNLIKTDMIQIEPTYKNFAKTNYEGDIINGYRFFKRISVTVKDIEKIEQMLSEIIYSGATNLYGVDYRSSEQRKNKDEARKEAINAAKEKAEMLAGELGQSIGKAIRIEEPSYGNPLGRQANVMQMSSQLEGGPDMHPGMIRVTATVNVTFELK